MEHILTRWIRVLVGSSAIAASVYPLMSQTAPVKATAKPAANETVTSVVLPATPSSLLPEALDGWVRDSAPKVLADPSQADPASAAALKEYDFTGAASATYKRDDETLNIHVLRFQDATGAYGAYSFYRQNGWLKEDIGAGATSFHNRVLFWKGDTVVDATFSHIGTMSAAEMRELASRVPDPPGTRSLMPPVLSALPKASLDGQTTHYAIGPTGYAGGGGVLPASLVGFDRGAEAVTANYTLTSGPATLTIIDYPTPQMAEGQEPLIRAYLKAGGSAQPPWPKPLVDSDVASLDVRRSGPLLAVVSGDAIPDESHKLLEMVHPANDVGSEKDCPVACGDCSHRDRWQQRGSPARILPRRRQGHVSHHAREACIFGF